jgi:hypothetical protein
MNSSLEARPDGALLQRDQVAVASGAPRVARFSSQQRARLRPLPQGHCRTGIFIAAKLEEGRKQFFS